ncbi:type IV pilus biogenesis/stability protein PilW [Thalassotalea aquiviva]|uniref:type IV pilus biogenesis/stability protein PilW n=1 Tax=Thalassotalea aquiviva TaxID=3242415 RepID=UPI00352B4E3B
MRFLIKNLFKNISKLVIGVVLCLQLSACVTQNYSENKPVVDRDYSDEQIAKTRVSLALGYLKIGNTTQAKLNLEKAKNYAPDMVEVYTAFAHYYETVGEMELTENAYLKALSIDHNDADTLNNFGVFLCRQQRYDDAEEYFLKAIKVPTYIRVSESYQNIALCHLKNQNFERTEWALSRSISHSPNSAPSLLQMAQLKYAKGEYESASTFISRFERATRRFSPQAIALAFKINKKLGQEDIASSYSSMLVSMYPESIQAQNFLDNGLAQIEEDQLALQYRKYKLLKSGIKVDKKPVVIRRKQSNLDRDGLTRQQPPMIVAKEKLVDDATIIQSTGQSINQNSEIAKTAGQGTTSPVIPEQQDKNILSSVKVPENSLVEQNKPVVPARSKPQGAKSVTDNGTEPTVHVVKKGDNLFQVSLKYNILISRLKKWNNLQGNTLHVGQVLKLTNPEESK